MMSLSGDIRADIIDAYNSISKYLDDLLNIDNPYFEGMTTQIYHTELQFNKKSIDTEATSLDFHLFISNDFVSSKIYDKHLFNRKFMTNAMILIGIVNFPFLPCNISHAYSYGVYICQVIRFPRASSQLTDQCS